LLVYRGIAADLFSQQLTWTTSMLRWCRSSTSTTATEPTPAFT